MKTTPRKTCGWALAVAGVLIAIASRWIVFPGLERLLGIEVLVGRHSVSYLPGGGYVFTNPVAMFGWVVAVAAFGLLVAALGFVLVLKVPHSPPNKALQRTAG